MAALCSFSHLCTTLFLDFKIAKRGRGISCGSTSQTVPTVRRNIAKVLSASVGETVRKVTLSKYLALKGISSRPQVARLSTFDSGSANQPKGSGRVNNPRRAGNAPKPGINKAFYSFIHSDIRKMPIASCQGSQTLSGSDCSLMHHLESEPKKKICQIFKKAATPLLLLHPQLPHHTPMKATMQSKSYSSDLLARLTQEEGGEWSKCLRKPKPDISIKSVKSLL